MGTSGGNGRLGAYQPVRTIEVDECVPIRLVLEGHNRSKEYRMCRCGNFLMNEAVEADKGVFQHWRPRAQSGPSAAGEAVFAYAPPEDFANPLLVSAEDIDTKLAAGSDEAVGQRFLIDADEKQRWIGGDRADCGSCKAGLLPLVFRRNYGHAGSKATHTLPEMTAVNVVRSRERRSFEHKERWPYCHIVLCEQVRRGYWPCGRRLASL